MSRICAKYTIELLSDTIMGSGVSIPGSVDIAVYKNASGYPYVKATSMKGLLLESMELLAQWSDIPVEIIREIMGEEGWNGSADDHRLHLTDAVLVSSVSDSEACFGERAFTKIKNGIAEKGTLRSAECICKGLQFEGIFECLESDYAFLQKAFAGVKWIGSMRNKGFGRVKVSCMQTEQEIKDVSVNLNTNYIYYSLKSEAPVIITNYGKSRGNSYETLDYIPGAAIRGMIIEKLVQKEPDWFDHHKKEILTETCFYNALPKQGKAPVLPSIKGFYEKKDETQFQTVLKDGELTEGTKRAKLGGYCSIIQNRILYWTAKTDNVTRIQCHSSQNTMTELFQTRYLEKGQVFEGYIQINSAAIAERICEVFRDVFWIGADRYAGFGSCTVDKLKEVDRPQYETEYGYQSADEPGEVLYLLLLSPVTMIGEFGEACGINVKELGQRLGVSGITIELCSTSLSEYSGYNRTWKMELPREWMYDAGSIFKIRCAEKPNIGKLLELQRNGVGIRRNEGFGQILFLKKELFESITGKKRIEEEDGTSSQKSIQRRKRINWMMEKSKTDWRQGLSDSQLGSLQERCEAVMNGVETLDDLYHYLDHNLKNRGSQHGQSYKKVFEFVNDTLNDATDDLKDYDKIARIQLICDLINYSRKGGGEEE